MELAKTIKSSKILSTLSIRTFRFSFGSFSFSSVFDVSLLQHQPFKSSASFASSDKTTVSTLELFFLTNLFGSI